jgi:hypothetical protein
VVLGSTNLSVENGKALAMGSDKLTVTFSAAAAGSRFGLFSLPAQLRTASWTVATWLIRSKRRSILTRAPTPRFCCSDSATDVDTSASGAMALGAAGTLKFGANASRAGALCRRSSASRGTGARDAVAEIIRSARLPRQVKSATDLPPGTWIIAEADGAWASAAAVTFGHDLAGYTRRRWAP